MYDKDQVRQRFLEEAERLISAGVAKSYSKLADGCQLQPYHFTDIRTSFKMIAYYGSTHLIT